MSAKRRVHLQLPVELEEAVRSVGLELGLGLGPAIRVVLGRGLGCPRPDSSCHECSAALASLIAAEHAVLMVASVLPEGERRMGEAKTRALEAARQRLAEVAPDDVEEAGSE